MNRAHPRRRRQTLQDAPLIPIVAQRKTVAEGEAAFADGKTVDALPYAHDGPDRAGWLHGWWGAYYARQRRDEAAIARWLDWECDVHFASLELCEQIASFIVTREHYDRTRPIANVLGGVCFTIPAPATLK